MRGSVRPALVLADGPPNAASGAAHHGEELVVVANVIGRIVTLGCKNEQCAVDGIAVLRRPHARRHMQAKLWCIEPVFLALPTVVDHYVDGAANADQKLMTRPVRMLAADFRARNVKDDEIAL